MATTVDTHNQSVSESKPTVSDQVTELDRSVGAAFIAAGIGSFVLALMIVLTEMKAGAGLKTFLTFSGPVGALSGKTTVAVIAFVVSWVGLHFAFKNRAVTLTRAFTIAIILIVLSIIFSFPPVFDLFAV
jgi:hypothetical protein